MRNAIAFYACAASAWLPPTPLHCTRTRARPAAQSDDDKVAAAEDESIGRRRFVEVLDIEPRKPSATEANRRWDASFPTWLVSLALLGPLEWLIIAPVLGFLPAKDMSPDVIRGVLATVALFFVVRDTDETPLRAAVALPLSPLRLTIDDEQLPVRVARRYDEDSVTAFAARGALGATYVVMSNLYAHGIAQPYVRDAFVRLASAAALTPEELYGDPERVLWPLVGAGLQGALLFAPLVAAVLAAGSSYAVEQAIIAPWRPAAPSETEIEECCFRHHRDARHSARRRFVSPALPPPLATCFRAFPRPQIPHLRCPQPQLKIRNTNAMTMRAVLLYAAAALLAKADDPWGLEHKDAYDVLKVPFDASREQIKQAYKARSKELHPDKLRKSDNEPFRQLRKAYDIVGFPRSKKKYDKEARKRHKHAPRRAENTLAADLAGDRKPINVVVGRLESGRALLLDEALVSRDGSHEARFEVDGNLRVREAGSRSIVWQTFAKPTRAKHGFGWLLLQHDGNLVLNSGDKGHVESVIWSSNSADPGASKSYLELDDDGGLRVHRRTADNAYAPCAWGSMGCGGGLAPVRNSIRVLLRSMFYPSALNRKKGVLSSLVGFLKRCFFL